MLSKRSVLFLFLCLVCLSLVGCSPGRNIRNLNSRGKNIICFGNSLTSGEGASPGNNYPAILARSLSLPVINAGRASDTTRDALKRIDADVLARNPKLVIVEFGGNDFLQGIPREETIKNLDLIVKKIQDAGAMVILLEVRTSLIGDSYLPGFKRIARQRGAWLIPDILKQILSNPSLKSDYIHPNDAGYKIMAERVLAVVKKILTISGS